MLVKYVVNNIEVFCLFVHCCCFLFVFVLFFVVVLMKKIIVVENNNCNSYLVDLRVGLILTGTWPMEQ